MRKETILMRVSVHPIKARLWELGISGQIESSHSLREIGKMVNEKSAQKIKHHLEVMVKMGAIDYVNGAYVFPKLG